MNISHVPCVRVLCVIVLLHADPQMSERCVPCRVRYSRMMKMYHDVTLTMTM